MGVLKICGHEMRKRLPRTEKNTSIRLVFRAHVQGEEGEPSVVQAVSEPISCGSPSFVDLSQLLLTTGSYRVPLTCRITLTSCERPCAAHVT